MCNIPGKTAPIVAEHAFGLMLAAKRAHFQTAELKAGRWTRMDNVYLRGKTLGLVGTGAIGGAMAELARAIGMEVLAWTFHPTPARAAALGVLYAPLDELLRTRRGVRPRPLTPAGASSARANRADEAEAHPS